MCGDSNVACKWINGEFAQGTKYKETLGKNKRIVHSWWKRRVAKPISDIDSFVNRVYRGFVNRVYRGFVNRVYREHTQEADHWANIATQGNRKIVIDRRDAATTWKAIRGFWDGSFNENGRSGCGIVIKAVDREKWDNQ